MLPIGLSCGDYFKQRLREIQLRNVQFSGETEIKRNFAIQKFVLTITSFSNLERLDLQHINNAPQVFKLLAKVANLSFKNSLKSLTVNSCILKEQNNDGWAQVQQTDDERVFEDLNLFILKLENLESLELQGMSIVDHLQDICLALRRPKLKALSLPCNGIEA